MGWYSEGKVERREKVHWALTQHTGEIARVWPSGKGAILPSWRRRIQLPWHPLHGLLGESGVPVTLSR